MGVVNVNLLLSNKLFIEVKYENTYFLVICLSIKRFIGWLIIFIGNKLMKVLVHQTKCRKYK